MTIGEKNRYITINKRDETVDTANESVGWVLHKKKWAQIVGMSGMVRIRSEASAGGVNTDLQRYSFRVNYDLSLTSAMQVVDGNGIMYDVQSVNHDHAHREHTDLVCQQGGANG
jgi:SPP1 family predicted phage head-tail adaptor